MKIVPVRVPATTANLGPGFDALGMALSLWNEAVFIQTHDSSIGVQVYGEGKHTLPSDERNLVLGSALQLYTLVGASPAGIQVHCFNRIPLASGLGSSSAAMLTGLLGANYLLGQPLSPEEVLTLAAQNEGHPDNVAPALLGGLVAAVLQGGKVIARRWPVKPLVVTIVLPDFPFPTRVARAVLPLSGAGPALIAFSARHQPAIGDAMRRAFRQAGLSSRVFHLRVSQRGAAAQVKDHPGRSEEVPLVLVAGEKAIFRFYNHLP